ncbi:gluconolactonase [Chitinophaga alhagiae]|uniref:Gluconolactonase n=1 Tax=Chitinophaga alhagiae TaxID=2203219 RepID=A0ABM6W9A9_9BACT|nr:IPT/TIG domain-containing protein [Chitinophaga alhagiae]AWO00530.1 gluconolactonase [Chitinophaga alhagiae]
MQRMIQCCLALLLTVMLACNKDKTPAAAPGPVISTVWPLEGTASTIVTIRGKHFSGVRTDNTVKFNGTDAIVIEAAEGQLQVVSPKAGATGAITVAVRNVEITGPVFTYTAPPEEYTVKVFAGDVNAGSIDGPVAAARLKSPEGVTMDAAGNLIITDRGNNRIRKISAAGIMSTVAGADAAGFVNGAAAAARFRLPWKSAADAAGNIFVADRDNHCIRKITPDGTVSTFAGKGTAGFADGDRTTAMFNQPLDVTVDAAGNIYVADNLNHRIRKITPDGTVSTLAGDGTAAYADGTGTAAKLKNPSGLSLDAAGNLVVADRLNHRIRKVTMAGEVTTLAGDGTSGYKDGDAAAARFADPYGITVDGSGNILVADLNNHKVRKLAGGTVSTVAGTGKGFLDGPGTSAQLSQPTDICTDAAGNIFVADLGNNCIRKISLMK